MVHDVDLHVLAAGRFEDVRQVGAGNHATVFAAWDRELERPVAIKVAARDTLIDILGGERLEALGIADGLQVLIDELGAASGQRYTLLREARLLASVSHPNVVRVLEVGLLDDAPAVIMPLLDGGSLAQRSFDGPWREPLELALELGEGLAAIHDAGLLHRDFKPNNILFDSQGRPQIADFGLACRADDASAMADWAGTTAYMAPETRARRARDQRDDVYAFCVVTFQMLHGHQPFASDAARLAGRLTRIERPIALPGELLGVLARGLAPDPEARWPDMRSLLTALREAARVPAPRRWPLLLSGAAAASVVGLLASSPVVHGSPSVAAAPAEPPAPARCFDRGDDASVRALELRELDLALALAVALDDDARASEALTKLSETARATGSLRGRARADYWRGRLARRAGQLDEAHAALTRALDESAKIEANTAWAEVTLELGELALARDQPDAALAYVELAHSIVSRHLPTRLADLLELEARALVASGGTAEVVRERLARAQTLRELEIERYAVSTRRLEQTLAVRAELELALDDPQAAIEIAERGLVLAEARADAPLGHSQRFRRLLLDAQLSLAPTELRADASTELSAALNDALAPYVFAGDEEGLAAEYVQLVEACARKGWLPDKLLASPPRARP